MTDTAPTAEEKALEAKKEALKAEIAKIAEERTTESGKACIQAAMKCVDLELFVEARHWVSLSLTADKTKADVKLHKALKALEEKGKKGDRARTLRRGAKAAE